MNKFKIGDRVRGKNIFGKGILPLEIIEVLDNKAYQCKVVGADVSMPYLEHELILDTRQ